MAPRVTTVFTGRPLSNTRALKRHSLRWIIAGVLLLVAAVNILLFSPWHSTTSLLRAPSQPLAPLHQQQRHKHTGSGWRGASSAVSHRRMGQDADISTSLSPAPPLPEKVDPPTAYFLCTDDSPYCSEMRETGECTNLRMFECQLSCGLCPLFQGLVKEVTALPVAMVDAHPPCVDEFEGCSTLKAGGKCKDDPIMLSLCKKTCGFCKGLPPDPLGQSTSPSSSSLLLPPAPPSPFPLPPSHLSTKHQAKEVAIQRGCLDNVDLCPFMNASLGMCQDAKHGWWMQYACRRSCGVCNGNSVSLLSLTKLTELLPPTFCSDFHPDCPSWAQNGVCLQNPQFMNQHCQLSCNACFSNKPDAVVAKEMRLAKVGASNNGSSQVSWFNLSSLPITKEAFEKLQKECMDDNIYCHDWAMGGQCLQNRIYMEGSCRLSCLLCHVFPPPPPSSHHGFSKRSVRREGDGEEEGDSDSGYVDDYQAKPRTRGLLPPSPPAPPDTAESLELEAKREKRRRRRAEQARRDAEKAAWRNKGSPGYGGGGASGQRGVWGGMNPNLASFWWLPDPPQKFMLNNGVLMPSIGFGAAALGEGTAEAVKSALSVGYRHIDGAQAREWYREDLVGQALEETSLPRSDIFLTSKIHPRHFGYTATLTAFNTSLEELHTPYLDLVLLHYSSCWGPLCTSPEPTPNPRSHIPSTTAGSWRDAWKALEELYRQGMVRAIGVSNFQLQDLEMLHATAFIKPQVLQVHMDPASKDFRVLQFCRANSIQMVAFSALGTQRLTGPTYQNPILTQPVLVSISKEVRKSVPQVIMRWLLQLGVIGLPRSHNVQHMKETLEIWDFQLSEEQMSRILGPFEDLV